MLPLVIGEERSSVGAAELPVGWHGLARAHLRHDPPSDVELESAIAAVEDAIAAAPRIARGSVLAAADPAIGEIASAAGVPAGIDVALSREAVEQTFQRMAARSPGVPRDMRFVATLVILRELMHHFDLPALAFSSDR